MSNMNLGRSISPYSNANFVADINRSTIYPFYSAAEPVHPSLYLNNNLTINGSDTINDPYMIN